MAEHRHPPSEHAAASSFWPHDRHNRELLANVRPADWTSPDPASRYHLVVIGGGTAGLVSAAAAAGLGAKVALVERAALGGDCLNHGCVPSKALIAAARRLHGARQFGVRPAAEHFSQAMEEVRRLRARISHHDSAERFSRLGVDVFFGDGAFTGPDTVRVEDRELRFRRAIVATGTRPMKPPIAGLESSEHLTNESVFNLTALPDRLAVIGAGPIGCELAQSFARFGCAVTLFEIAAQVLPREDPEASALLEGALQRDGVVLELGSAIRRIERQGDQKVVAFTAQGEEHRGRFDQILLATGRAPNVENLGLEKAGVRFSPAGVEVDPRLRSSNRRIFAVGDVASEFKFTHVADALARIAIQNALFFGRKRASDLVIPWCTYTDPEIAHVGLYETQARERGLDVETVSVSLSEVDRAVLESADDGFLRLVAVKGKGRVVGATLVAPHAGDLLGELCLAATQGIDLGKISATIHPYPTHGEIVRKAGDNWMRGRLTPLVRTVLGLVLRLVR